MTEDDFLRAIAGDPASAPDTWLVLADWLEERGDARAELVRLKHDPGFWPDLAGGERDERVRELLAAGVPPVVPSLTNSIGMRFVLIPAGRFLMGSPRHEDGRNADEGPRHEVRITRPFWLGAFEVTQQEYHQVMGVNPSRFSKEGHGAADVRGLDTSRLPVENVSWDNAAGFCERLSELPEERGAGRAYRLPTEAEWEYACRAGATDGAPFHYGWQLWSARANFNGQYPYGGAAKGPLLGRTAAVGSHPPNAWGLSDMHGNVWEWCADWRGRYSAGGQTDPTGPAGGVARVMRGASWLDSASHCRAAYRASLPPVSRGVGTGFRACFGPG